MVRALITGITGQDGQYLADLLVGRGYEVFGLVRDPERVGAGAPPGRDLRLLPGDLRDEAAVCQAVKTAQPDEIYNLGGLTSVTASWDEPTTCADVNVQGAVRLLRAMRTLDRPARLFQASSSEIFGAAEESPQRESTPLRPRNPYGASKALAHWIVREQREKHGVFAGSGILFNHESPRRGTDFVTRKITRAVARIALGRQDRLILGDLDARRDWGFAGDYVEAMWLMLQQATPDDFVIASGETHSVGEFAALAFAYVGISSWRNYVQTDPAMRRGRERAPLVGDPCRARARLGWQPRVSFPDLVAMMVEADLAAERAAPS